MLCVVFAVFWRALVDDTGGCDRAVVVREPHTSRHLEPVCDQRKGSEKKVEKR